MTLQNALSNILTNHPKLDLLFQQEPSLIGIDDHYIATFAKLFIVFLGAYVVLITFLLSLIYVIYLFKYNAIKKNLSVMTKKTFNMLFRVLTIQLLVFGTAIMVPCLIAYGVQFFRLKGFNGLTVVIMIPFSFHHTMDFLCVMYFIIPFRIFIVEKLKGIRALLNCNVMKNRIHVMINGVYA
uniref:G protein-coupled receptor n=1 Tax=Acrobeloides nanus TaxID=290746 RepID=A0A914D3Z2_9BILA